MVIRLNCLLADQFLKFTQLLLNDTSHFFDSAIRLKIGIVSQFALSLFSRSFCVVKVAFNLLPCAVCPFLPRTFLFSIPRLYSKCRSGSKTRTRRPTPKSWLVAATNDHAAGASLSMSSSTSISRRSICSWQLIQKAAQGTAFMRLTEISSSQ
jgi:hypothetical protein